MVVRVDTGRLHGFVRRDEAGAGQVLFEWQNQGSSETMAALRSATPVRRGLTRESIDRRFTPKGFVVFFNPPYDKVAGYLEHGTAPHMIFPSGAKVLSWRGTWGEQRFAKRVRHPGTRALFFIQRTREAMLPFLRELYRNIWEKHHQ